MDGLAYLQTIRDSSGKAEIALSVGGDNYCYDGTAFYAYLNRAYRRGRDEDGALGLLHRAECGAAGQGGGGFAALRSDCGQREHYL